MSKIFVCITLSLALHIFAVLSLFAEQSTAQFVVDVAQPTHTVLPMPKMVQAAQVIPAAVVKESLFQSSQAPATTVITDTQSVLKAKNEIKRQVKTSEVKPELQLEKTAVSQAQHAADRQQKLNTVVPAEQKLLAPVTVSIAQLSTEKQQRTGIDKPSTTATTDSLEPQVAEVLSKEPRFARAPVAPVYPAQAKRRQQQGTVWMEVRLDTRGKPVELQVLRSSGVKSLDLAALSAVRKWRFLPETRNGIGVPSRVHIPIEFAIAAKR